ncbi:MAG: hypothetical protein ACK4UO_19690 [Pseudolabrys sp.]
MADKDIDKPNGEAERPDIQPPEAEAKATEAKQDLPVVESPPLSPATETEPAPVEAVQPPLPEPPSAATTAETPPPFEPEFLPAPAADDSFMRRPGMLLAASLAIAVAFGAVAGTLASGGFNKPAPVDTAALEERKAMQDERKALAEDRAAMQRAIARLTGEIGTLKVNVEAANKAAHSQIARLNDKLSERLAREAAEITGSIATPQTVPAAPAPEAAPAPAAIVFPQGVTPLPPPRPVHRVAAVDRAPIVSGWSIRDVRDGYVYVQGYGDIYRVVPGVPLPGVGLVQSIRRQDGRWIVVTSGGLIVASRDRRYFDSF